MAEIVPLHSPRDDTLWAVFARMGKISRVANIYQSRAAALEDREWREAQVRAHASFLRTTQQPPPQYSVAPVRRTDLPKGWKPLPALGFLRGQFI
jgi:hypothetical protein